MNNKKGIVSLTVIAFLVLLLILIGAFFFVKLRFFLIGFGFIGAGIFAVISGGEFTRRKSIFALMFIVVGILVLLFQGFVSQTTFAGSNTLGLQKVDYFSSSNACFDSGSQPLWVYTIAGGGASGQYATGSYSPNLVGDLYSGNTQPSKTFKVTTQYRQYCDYQISTNLYATPIYELGTPTFWKVGFFEYPSIARCGNQASEKTECTQTGQYKYGLTNDLYCWCSPYIKRTGAIGNYLTLNNPSVRTTGTITSSDGITTYSEDMSSVGNSVKTISPNVCAVWNGQLVSGQTCGELTGGAVPLPIYVSGTNNWQLISKDTYDTYLIKWNTLNNELNIGGMKKDDISSKISTFNYYPKTALSSKLTYGTINNPASITGAKVVKELSTLIQYPIITMYIKANWLGVVTPSPIASITQNPTSECFVSGQNGVIQLKVKNIGEQGTIAVTGTCDGGFIVQKDEQTYNSGEEKTIYLTLTGSTGIEEFKSTCTIKASALTQSVSRTVEVCVEGIPTCELIKDTCKDNNIVYCPTPFSEITLKENCVLQGAVCEYDKNGLAYCKIEGKEPVCGNGICEEGETKFNCKVDCDKKEDIPCDERTPKWMGWEIVETERQTIWSITGIAKPREETYCKATNAPYVFGGAVVIIIVLSSLAMFIIPKKRIKGKSTKFGKIGK